MATPESHSYSEILHKLEKQLTCPICLELFSDPKFLPCFHSFCFKCLENVHLELQLGYTLPCPTCRSPCQLSQEGVKALPSSFTINNLTEVYNMMMKVPGASGCDRCNCSDAGSPMSSHVSKMRDTPVKTIGTGLIGPGGIAVTYDRQVIVCDESGHCVAVIDSKDGRKVRSFGSQGSGRGQFLYPDDIAITSKGTLLVTDSNNHRIQEFTMDGECLSCVGSRGNGPLQFSNPSGIAVNKTTGQVYVAEFCNDRVHVLNADLTFSHMFGTCICGSGQGQFDSPRGVAIDGQGLVYVVADSVNHCIQQFTPEGKHLASFGTKGSGPGQLTHPYDITVDTNDLLYVCEGGPNSRVSVFTTTGEFVHCFGEDQIAVSSRATFDKSGNLYISDHRKSVIKIF